MLRAWFNSDFTVHLKGISLEHEQLSFWSQHSHVAVLEESDLPLNLNK